MNAGAAEFKPKGSPSKPRTNVPVPFTVSPFVPVPPPVYVAPAPPTITSKLRADAPTFIPKDDSFRSTPVSSVTGSPLHGTQDSPLKKSQQLTPLKTPTVTTSDVDAPSTFTGTPPSLRLHRDPNPPPVLATPEAPAILVKETVPFETSKLVIPETKPIPPEAPKFNSLWTLYADDHPVLIGDTAKFFDPVQIKQVGDLETFWRLWRYLPLPSRRVPSFTYQWFRKDIKPSWEEPRNKNGGTVNIVVYDKDRQGLQSKGAVDDSFLLVVLACTGETLAESTSVNGIVLKIRKSTTLQLWTSTSELRTLQILSNSVRALLAQTLEVKALAKFDFFSHSSQAAAPQAKPSKGKNSAKAVPSKVKEADFHL